MARVLAEHKLELLAAESKDNISFWLEATDVLRDVIPFDFHPCWFTVDPVTLLVTGHMNEGLEHTPPEIARAWYAEEDVNSPATLNAMRIGATTVKAATKGDAASSWRWRNLLEPMGFDDSLDAVFRNGKTVWGAVNLLHRSDSRPYTEEDVRFISRMSGAFAMGTKLGLLRGQAATDRSIDSPAVLIVNADLISKSTTENALDVLADLPDIGGFRPDRLPLPVQVVALRAAAADDGEAATVVRTRSGRWVRVQGSRLAGTATEQVAIVVSPATAENLAPIRLAAHGLTPRETEVVELVLRGRSTTEIASQLFISEYTVQDRLKSIFEKVGVRSRRELVALIHQTDYSPVVAENDDRIRAGLPMKTRPDQARS